MNEINPHNSDKGAAAFYGQILINAFSLICILGFWAFIFLFLLVG